MNTLVPYANTARARAALHEAMQIAQPGDTITAIAVVEVPAYYAPDVEPGIVWTQTCRAERCLGAARAQVATFDVPDGITLRCVRVQARDAATAIVRGAEATGADLILFAGRAGVWGGVARTFGTVGAVARHAPCGVRVVTTTRRTAVSVPGEMAVPERTPLHDAVAHLLRRREHHVYGK